MKLLFTVLLAAPMFACQVFACQIVEGDKILGKDLAAANPVFAKLDPEMVIGPAPLAGVRRVWHAEESVRLARLNNIAAEAPFGELCFERATGQLTAEALLPVLRSALAIEGAQIEILDFSRYGVPRGNLEFTRDGLTPAGLWRGRVTYAEGRSVSVWARVRVTSEQTWVEAVEPLAPGKIVDAAQLVVRKGQRFPFGAAPLDSVETVVGKKLTRTVHAGEPIFAFMLIAPYEIERGDKVTVEVSSGEAKLGFEATAETAGRAGGSVLIRNPENGRRFQARVEGKGKVSITK